MACPSEKQYYSVVFIYIHRKRSVNSEGYPYVVFGEEEQTREILDIFNKPLLSGEMMGDLYKRDVD